MNKFFLPILVAGIVLIGSANAQQKIGFVNLQKIYTELPQGQEFIKKRESLGQSLQDELERRKKVIQDKADEYSKKKTVMNDAAKKAAEEELFDMQNKLVQYRDEKAADADKELKKLKDPLDDKILKGIERVAKEQKYTMVLDQAAVLFGETGIDLTYKVIDKVRTGK